MRSSQTAFLWVKGYNREEENEGADKFAAKMTIMLAVEHLNLTVLENFNLTKAKLSAMFQSTLYQEMISLKSSKQKLNTTMHLDITRYVIEYMSRHMLSNK